MVLCCVLCPGAPEGSYGCGSGFKASQKTEPQFKVSFDRLGETGNRTSDPWITRHRSIPYITAASVFIFFVAVFLCCTSTGRVHLCFLWLYVQETQYPMGIDPPKKFFFLLPQNRRVWPLNPPPQTHFQAYLPEKKNNTYQSDLEKIVKM